MTDKRTLRARLRAARAAAPRSLIPVPAAFRDRLHPGCVVASYIPVGGEADPAPLVAAARDAGCILALPHVVDRATPIRFLAWDTELALAPGPFGLSQPADETEALAPAIILTPLVGFDRRGNRIGQGAGHYDRAFAAFPDAWRVGVALAVQEVDSLVPDAWDVPLHAIVTDTDWIVPAP